MIPNSYKEYKSYAIMTTHSKHGRSYLIDKDCVEKVKQFQWYSDKKGYASCKRMGKVIRLHRLVLNYDGELTVDHINRDVTDNRKENLRVATWSVQNKNRKTPWNVEQSKTKTIINGICFDSITEASKCTGIPRTTLNDIKLKRYNTTRKYNELSISFEGVIAHD